MLPLLCNDCSKKYSISLNFKMIFFYSLIFSFSSPLLRFISSPPTSPQRRFERSFVVPLPFLLSSLLLFSPLSHLLLTFFSPPSLITTPQRRFECSFVVPLPDYRGRIDIFRKVLYYCEVERGLDYAKCARLTDGYSPR